MPKYARIVGELLLFTMLLPGPVQMRLLWFVSLLVECQETTICHFLVCRRLRCRHQILMIPRSLLLLLLIILMLQDLFPHRFIIAPLHFPILPTLFHRLHPFRFAGMAERYLMGE